MWPYLSVHKHPEASSELLSCQGMGWGSGSHKSRREKALRISHVGEYSVAESQICSAAGGVTVLALRTPLEEGEGPALPQSQM